MGMVNEEMPSWKKRRGALLNLARARVLLGAIRTLTCSPQCRVDDDTRQCCPPEPQIHRCLILAGSLDHSTSINL